MTDQDQNQNLPVEDESSADPVKLPENIAETPSEIVADDESKSSPRRHPELDSGSSAPSHNQTNKSDDKPELANEAELDEDDAEEEDSGKYSVPANVFDETIPGQWYVLHTYSGYEDAVADSLRQRIDSLDMKDKIFHVIVPKEKQIEIKNGKRKTVEKKIFPGYVLVKMLVTEASWYVVRNTPSVTGFIGSGTIPVPISDAEMETIKKRMVVEEPKHKIDLKIGDLVHITDGPFKEYDGTVSEVDEARGKIKVLVSIFGRETPVELDFLQVKRV